MGQYIPTTEAAVLADLTADYIRDLCREGRIESQKFGHIVMVDKASLLAHITKVQKWRKQRSGKPKADKADENGQPATEQ